MVFYRKYRPQKIEDLDTILIRKNLGAVLSSGNVPHAFLFTGPRGLGKTSAARIVAKSVNCDQNSKWAGPEKSNLRLGQELKGQNSKSAEPCNTCTQCTSITNGTNLDVLEIDGASNRGIDEIRDLREKIKLAPTSGRFKVYIIDEVHMLTTEAFNALLKTLEEPPNHAIFILCTTEANKLPQTIISRCLRFDFKRATEEELVKSLQRIAKGENLKIKEEVFWEIAKGADGSFRDGAKLLEQAVLLGEEITLAEVKELLGQTENLKPEELLKFLAKKDARAALLEINRLTEAGENLRVYTEKILSLLHQLLMARVGIELEITGVVADKFEKKDIVKLISLFSQAYSEEKTAIIPQLPLELAVVEYCETMGLNDGALVGPAARHLVGAHSLTSGSAPTRSPAVLTRGGRIDSSATRQSISVDMLQNDSRTEKKSDLSELWPQIIEATKKYNHTLAGVLRGCRPGTFDGKILTITASYKFHKDKLSEPKVREVLDNALFGVFGKRVLSKCVLNGETKDVRKDGEKNV